jgi:hypothetical protein
MQLPWKPGRVEPASEGERLETGSEQADVTTANTAGGNGQAPLSSAVANTVGHTRAGSGAASGDGRDVVSEAIRMVAQSAACMLNRNRKVGAVQQQDGKCNGQRD